MKALTPICTGYILRNSPVIFKEDYYVKGLILQIENTSIKLKKDKE